MIGTVSVRVNAGHPNIPLAKIICLQSSAVTIGVSDVPASRGLLAVTGVSVAVTNAAGTCSTVSATLKSGVWTATFPATHFAAVGSVSQGVKILATGTSETGAAETWILGQGDLEIRASQSTPAPGESTTFLSDKTFDGQTLDISTEDGMYNGLKKVLATMGATVACALMCVFAAPPAGYTNDTYTSGSTTWTRHGALNTRASYVVTDTTGGASGVDTNAVRDIASSPAVTNAGAVAYADGTFLKTSGGTISGGGLLRFENEAGGNASLSGYSLSGYFSAIYCNDIFFPNYLYLWSWEHIKKVVEEETSINYESLPEYLASTAWHGTNKSLADYGITNDFATASAIASATNGLARAEDVRTLSGAIYDFDGGTNFTLRLYTALTNVIERMGGSVTNAPIFQ